MIEFHSLENPPLGKAEQLSKELSKYPEIKPRLTFMFPVSESRRKILDWLKGEGAPSEREIVDAMKNEDFIVRQAGLRLLNENPRLSKENLSVLDQFAENEFINEEKTKDEIIAVKVRALMSSLPPEESVPDIKEIVKNSDSVAKATIARELANYKYGLPILEELIKSADYYIRRLAAQSKIKIITENEPKEKALLVAEQMSRSGDWIIQEAGIKGLAQFEDALPIIKEFSEHSEESIKETLARSLADFKNSKEVISILEKLEQDKYKMVRESAALSKVKIIIRDYPKEEVLSVLEEMIQDKNLRQGIAKEVADFKYGLPILEKLSEDERPNVKSQVVWSLSNFGEQAFPLLKKLSEDEDEIVRKGAVLVRYEIEASSKESYDYLLATKKRLFATAFTEKLAERILKLQKITGKLEEKFGEQFIGLIVFGSTAKGYFMPGSDLDYCVIARKYEILDHFEDLAESESLEPCMANFIEVKEGYKAEGEYIKDLYYGLCFPGPGGWKEILKLQEQTLKDLDEKQWDSMRREILEEQIRIDKAGSRFSLKKEKLEKIKQVVALLTVPPPREQALKIIKRRLKRLER